MIQNMNVKICEHVKQKINTQDQIHEKLCCVESRLNNVDELCKKLDKMEEIMKKHEETIDNFKEAEYITITQLQEVVEDVKESFESVLNLTPRNQSDLKIISQKMEVIEKKLFELESTNEMMSLQNNNLSVKTSDRDFNESKKIPKINLAFRERRKKE